MDLSSLLTSVSNLFDQWLGQQTLVKLLILGVITATVLWIMKRLVISIKRDARLESKLAELEEAVKNQVNELSHHIDINFDKNQSTTDAAVSGLAERMGRIDATQANLAAISGQILGLERILSDKQARGAFGEARLGDLLRDALPASAYQEQATLANGRRADALLALPHPPGPIAVDSKFPLESFRSLINAENPEAERAARRSFERDVIKHISDISDRYIVPNQTADCALMFVPSEAVFAELHARSTSAINEGYKKRVFVVSPSTMWALLNTVRAVMKDVQLRDESIALQAEAQALVSEVTLIARSAEIAKRRIELAGADLYTLAEAAKKAERQGSRIRDLDLN